MNNPQVSIVALNYNYPHNLVRMLPSVTLTSGVRYEMIMVDNGSTPDVVALAQFYKDQGFIDKLVLNPENEFFSEGCNIGVRHSDPTSEYILLLNNDVQILHPCWLTRMIEWSNGIPETLLPYTWSDYPTYPKDIRRGIVSIDWGYDTTIPGYIRPEGWCCLIRREAWREMSPDFPMWQGDMEMMASAIRDGHPCGVLSQYGRYITHYNGGSRDPKDPYPSPLRNKRRLSRRQPDPDTWWKDLSCEGLDFTLGPNERQSYMEW